MLEDNEKRVGIHFIININNVDDKIIYSENTLFEIFEELIKICNVTVLNKTYHKFKPYGLTGLYLLSESHLSFHTWPEYNKICLDIFTCGKNKEQEIKNFLNKLFTNYTFKIIER